MAVRLYLHGMAFITCPTLWTATRARRLRAGISTWALMSTSGCEGIILGRADTKKEGKRKQFPPLTFTAFQYYTVLESAGACGFPLEPLAP